MQASSSLEVQLEYLTVSSLNLHMASSERMQVEVNGTAQLGWKLTWNAMMCTGAGIRVGTVLFWHRHPRVRDKGWPVHGETATLSPSPSGLHQFQIRFTKNLTDFSKIHQKPSQTFQRFTKTLTDFSKIHQKPHRLFKISAGPLALSLFPD